MNVYNDGLMYNDFRTDQFGNLFFFSKNQFTRVPFPCACSVHYVSQIRTPNTKLLSVYNSYYIIQFDKLLLCPLARKEKKEIKMKKKKG